MGVPALQFCPISRYLKLDNSPTHFLQCLSKLQCSLLVSQRAESGLTKNIL